MTVELVSLSYVCRVCGAHRDVYVSPRRLDEHVGVVDDNLRLTVTRCDSERCEQDRTHVLARALSNGATGVSA